jgi:hypothetical protein
MEPWRVRIKGMRTMNHDVRKYSFAAGVVDSWKAMKTYSPDYQTAGGPQRSLEVSDTLLHGGLDSPRHVSCTVCMIRNPGLKKHKDW